MEPDDIPQWAWGEAIRVERSLTAHRSIGDMPNLANVERIARALIAAEQRGKNEGLAEAAEILRDNCTIAGGEAVDPAAPEIIAAIRSKIKETQG